MKKSTLSFVLASTLSLTAAIPSTLTAQQSGTILFDLDAASFDPPIVERERLTVEVLPGTGVCGQPMMSFGFPCPIIRLPDGTERPAAIVGFSRPGPLTIEIDRLIYDYDGWTVQDYIPPAFEYAGNTEYRIWSREEWAPCPDHRCTPPAPPEFHPAYGTPLPDIVAREFVELELLSDQGVCVFFSLPENQEFACHEVRLPTGEVISLDIGVHERFPIGAMLYMQQVTHAAPHPLLDYDRFDFFPYARP